MGDSNTPSDDVGNERSFIPLDQAIGNVREAQAQRVIQFPGMLNSGEANSRDFGD